MSEKAPVDAVGGTQEEGPWPADVDEIVEGNSYVRQLVVDGQVVEREVTVTSIQQVHRADGTPTDGYVVAFQHSGGA